MAMVAQREISRRAFLRVAGGVAVGAASVPLLAACAPAAPSATTAGGTPAPAAAAGSGGKVKLPSYIPLANLPPPDLPGTPDGSVSPGYQKYPTNLITSVPKPLGSGDTVNGLTVSLSPAPPPLDQNPTWQQVNKLMGVSLNLPSISTADYGTRLNTVVAGADLPDIIMVSVFGATMSNMAYFLNSACADLTPYLSGDAVKDYPNLANLPSTAWPNAVFNNKIMTVPLATGGMHAAPILFARWGALDQAGISQITSADDFMGICKQLTVQGTRWALGANTLVGWLGQVFGAPNGWKMEGGKFTNAYETPEYKQAVLYHRQLWDAGVFYPDSPGLAGSPAGLQYYAGKFIFSPHASWSQVPYQTVWDRATASDPNFKPRPVLPFKADGSGRAAQYVGGGSTGIAALKKASADRVKELLGVLNFMAAPFGTTEALLLQYGVEGPDFKRDANGNPVPTEQGSKDTLVPWKNVSGPPDYLFDPTSPDYVSVTYQLQKEHFAVTLANPTVGLYSPTDGSKGISLRSTFTDQLNQLLFGQQPVSGFDDLVSQWRQNGGDTIRAEYEKAYAAANA